MRRNIFILCLLAVSVLLSGNASAKENNWIVHRHTQDDGLTHNAVRAVLRDSKGYVWLGTSNGLNRYNGREYEEIIIEGGIPDNNYITALREDAKGNIWIGTAVGVCVYKPGHEKATRFAPLAEYDFQVYQIVRENDSHLLIPDKEFGFFRIDTEQETVQRIETGNNGSISYSPIALCMDAGGSAWFINADGALYRSSDRLKTIESIIPSEGSPFKGKRIHKMHYAAGFLMVGMTHHILTLNIRTGEQRTYKSISNIYAIHVVSEEEIWAACDNGIIIFDSDMTVQNQFLMTDLPGGGSRGITPNSALLDICSDGGNGFWIGSFGGAIHLLQNRTGLTAHRGYFTSRFVPAKDGSVWIGTENKGLLRFFPSENRLEKVKLNISSTNIQGLCLDGENLIIGAWASNRLTSLNTRTGVVKSYPISFNATSLCRIEKDCILIGSTSGLRLFSNGTISSIEELNISIRHLYADRHDNIWLSTNHDGLFRLSRSSLGRGGPVEFEQFTSNVKQPSCLQSNKVCCVFEDKQGNLWVGTENAGFYQMDQSRGTFRRIEAEHCKAAYGFSEDNRGFIWITTDRGLLCLDPHTGNLFRFRKGDELLSDQYNYNSNIIDESGFLYAGTSIGFIRFDTNKFPLSSKGEKLLLPSAEYVSSLHIKYKDNHFTLPVSSISNDVLDNSKIMWRCSRMGVERWTELEGGAIPFNDARFGEYELQLHLQSVPNKEVLDRRRLLITVETPLFLRWWAWLIYVFLLASVILLATIVTRRKTRKKIQDETNKLEAEYAKNLYVSKLDFITDLAHEIRTPLTLITGPAESIRSKLARTADPAILEEINILSRNTERLNELMLQLMDFRSIERQGYAIHPEDCDLSDILKRIYDRFSHHGIDYCLVLPENPVKAMVDVNAVDRIVSNLLTNAFKYSSTTIVLRLENLGETFRVICENDGAVVPAQMRERIFKPFVRYREGKHNISGSGIGLYTARSLAQLIGGTLRMDNDFSINRFILEAPLTATESKSAERPEYQEPVTRSFTPGPEAEGNGGTRLLIVEDNEEMRAFLVRILSGYFTILQARDGQEALETLFNAEQTPDMILSDVMMPRKNGFELCQAVKEDINFCHIPVVLLTAKADTESKVEGMEYGADSYVEKPFAPEYLVAVLQGIWENRKRLQAYYSSKPLVKSSSLPHSDLEDKLIQKVEQFMEERLDDQTIRVEDIACAANMSKSSLQRKMQALYGMSVNEYIILYRLKAAARIMDSEDVPVSEVGFRVGFTSHSYFSKCFKKQFGISPSEFKERPQ